MAALTGVALLRVSLIPGPQTALGLEFMRWSVEINLLATTLAGIGLFSTQISSERESGTLSLLRLAGLGTAGIIFARWLPLLISCSMLLIVQIPFAMFAVTLGGVTPSQVIAAYAMMCLHLFFVSSIGLWASVQCRTSAGAVILATVLLGVWCFGAKSLQPILVLLGGFSRSIGHWAIVIQDTLEPYRAISGFSRVPQILSPGNSRPQWGDWPDVLQLGLGILAVFGAWASLEFRTSKDEPVLLKTSARKNRRLRPWKYAVVWKEFMFLAGGWRGMAVRAVLYPFVGMVFCDGWNLERMYEPAIRMLGWDGAILMAQVFSRELREETWDTLRLTPVTLRQLCHYKLAGVALALIPGTIWVLITQRYWPFIYGSWEPVFFCSVILFGWHVSALASVFFHRFTWAIAFLIGLVSATVEFQMVGTSFFLRNYPSLTLFWMSIVNLIICILLYSLVGLRIRALSQ